MYKPAFNPAGRLLAALALFFALAPPALAADTYRAEIVILERLADPILNEQMGSKQPEIQQGEKRLWVVDESGNRNSDIRTTNNLTLNTAASRLENSGKYKVLMKTGWIQKFPPNYNGDPMRVEVGEFLERAGHRAVEGTIEINRRRYLLVNVQLNHWQETGGSNTTTASSEPATREETPNGDNNEQGDSAGADTQGVGTSPASMPGMSEPSGKELVTWIREVRRMRSKEIHFLDSPTIGVLVYFRPLD
ncbi:CsiV family protein [Marinobacter lacisalsi]|uniref:CsiV family protein n=1 Tax=Marinobacter lacisalsi TaxID=475979 RepID=A0ABV8QE35_9GAMM